jgi:hypothetical protein
MELTDARAYFVPNHAGLMKYHLTIESIRHNIEHIIRYLRVARALEIDLIKIISATGDVTTKVLDANCNKVGNTVVLVGFISGFHDAKQVTFNLPALNSVWNIHKGERAIVYNSDNASLVMMNWGRAKGVKANVTTTEITEARAKFMFTQSKWVPETFFGSSLNITIGMDRSLKEQIGVEALMSLPVANFNCVRAC